MLEGFTLKIIVVGLCAMVHDGKPQSPVNVLCVDATEGGTDHGREPHKAFFCVDKNILDFQEEKEGTDYVRNGFCPAGLGGAARFDFEKPIYFKKLGTGNTVLLCDDIEDCTDMEDIKKSIDWIPELCSFFSGGQCPVLVSGWNSDEPGSNKIFLRFQFAGVTAASGRRFGEDAEYYKRKWYLKPENGENGNHSSRSMNDQIAIEIKYITKPDQILLEGVKAYGERVDLTFIPDEAASQATIVIGNLPVMPHLHDYNEREVVQHFRWFYELLDNKPSNPMDWKIPVSDDRASNSVQTRAARDEFCPLVRLTPE